MCAFHCIRNLNTFIVQQVKNVVKKVSLTKLCFDSLKFNFLPEICFLRLDFESLTLTGPSGTTILAGGLCSIDSFKVSGSKSAASIIPTICGENAGQHSEYFKEEFILSWLLLLLYNWYLIFQTHLFVAFLFFMIVYFNECHIDSVQSSNFINRRTADYPKHFSLYLLCLFNISTYKILVSYDKCFIKSISYLYLLNGVAHRLNENKQFNYFHPNSSF